MLKKEAREERRDQIIGEARRLFEQYGLRKTCLEDVAKAVGLVTTSLYHYFGSKEDLFREVIRTECDCVVKEVQRAMNRESSPASKLGAWLEVKVQRRKRQANLYREVMEHLEELQPWITEERRQFLNRERALITGVLKDGVEKGVFDILDPTFTTLVLMAAVRGLNLTYAQCMGQEPDVDQCRAMLHLILKGLLKR